MPAGEYRLYIYAFMHPVEFIQHTRSIGVTSWSETLSILRWCRHLYDTTTCFSADTPAKHTYLLSSAAEVRHLELSSGCQRSGELHYFHGRMHICAFVEHARCGAFSDAGRCFRTWNQTILRTLLMSVIQARARSAFIYRQSNVGLSWTQRFTSPNSL